MLILSGKEPKRKKPRYDFVVSRAVSEFSAFVKLTEKNIDPVSRNNQPTGSFTLKEVILRVNWHLSVTEQLLWI